MLRLLGWLPFLSLAMWKGKFNSHHTGNGHRFCPLPGSSFLLHESASQRPNPFPTPALLQLPQPGGPLHAAGSAETGPSQELESLDALWGVSSQGQGWSGHARDRHHPADKGELDILSGPGTALQPHTRTKASQTLCLRQPSSSCSGHLQLSPREPPAGTPVPGLQHLTCRLTLGDGEPPSM